MSYAQGKYGILYHPPPPSEGHPGRKTAAALAAAVLIALVIAGIMRHGAVPPLPDPPVVATGQDGEGRQDEVPPAPPEVIAGAAENSSVPVQSIIADRMERTGTKPREQVEMMRFKEAEKRHDVKMAIDSLEKLIRMPAFADIRDKLMRRLGELNLALLFSNASTPWTLQITVRRGDSRDRIAREYRNTTAVVDRLNPGRNWQKIKPNDVVRVLDYPNAVLVVHKHLGNADLFLKNEKFFRRYQAGVDPSAKPTTRTVGSDSQSTARAILRDLGLRASPPDRAELEMFLSAGSRISVSDE